ncbi:Flagellar secretion chaperone FliS [Candidatus Magnetomoraceae bacterium gMMP-15]
MTSIGYEAYKTTAIQATNNKEKILLMLFEGAIRFTKFAQMGIEKNDLQAKGENISKVLAILNELDCALDKKYGQDLADNLTGLYQFMMRRLTHANMNNDITALKEVEKFLGELQDAFKGAAEQSSGKDILSKNAAQTKMSKGMHFAI